AGTLCFRLAVSPRPHAQQFAADAAAASLAAPGNALLGPTNHPRLPRDISQLWLAPKPPTVSRAAAPGTIIDAIKLVDGGSYEKALPVLSSAAAQQGPLGDYAAYYAAFAQLRLGRNAEARRMFQALAARTLIGYLTEATSLGEAEADEALNEPRGAVEIYERLLADK